MLLLGIETLTPVSSVALWDGSVRARADVARSRGHVEFLMSAIVDVCARADAALRDVSGVVVGVGPGLFTGMRVGIATAKTIAQTLDVPIVGISSLDALAFPVRHSPKLICACIDARRSEYFAAMYRGTERVSDHAAWTLEALTEELQGKDVLLTGEIPPGLEGEPIPAAPKADSLVEMARMADAGPVAEIEPLYLRKTDAEIKWDTFGVTIERPLRVKIR